MAFSQYLADEILDWFKGGAFPSAPSDVYISVHTGDPGVSGTSNDVTSAIRGNSNRVQVSTTAFTAIGNATGGGREITNVNVVQITTSAANNTTQSVTHFGVWDAITGGNFLASGTLTSSVSVQSGDTVQFNQNAMAIRVV